ncbi:fumarate reductase flavoprotein subunit [Alkalibacterium putridalgicola]|uniref:Flavocytochrome c n=1 Tax=Alkalibacterium putridalgicola TaxID=426703 RepID=A0A1H7UFA8_9LACT|nr:flavocytochrome c [Alkalibacterium putridalgicola]GEK89591.1 flavocytochrome c [Alkalibacterium putridalgicola]SEL95434.1 fumarate reductase flavoprotein subunit [Alkalibacterium putridalgicola]
MKNKLLLRSLLGISLFLTGCSDSEDTAATDSATDETASEVEKTETGSEERDVVTSATYREYTDISELEDSYDVIIVGSGGAGLSAAIEAKDAGANPVIFEMMPVAGGNTKKSSAGMNASETKFQEAAGVKDTNAAFFNETLAGGNETNNEELLHYMVDHSANAIDWLDSIGITLDNLTTTGGMSVERTHRPSDGSAVGEYLVNGLLDNIEEREIPVFVNSQVTQLLEEDGKITGVEVLVGQTEERTVNSEAVVVATGGFGANPEMVVEYDPDLEGFVTTNHEGSTGTGIDMISALGGDVVDMSDIQIHPTVQQSSGYLITEAVRGEGAILVSKEGIRFTNEMNTRDIVSADIIALPEQKAYLIFDDGVRERVKAIEKYDSEGFVMTGESLEALAEAMSLPEEALKETVEAWNTAVAEGKDETFNRSTAMDEDLSTGSYYAIEVAPGVHHTMGGVRINTLTEVLNTQGNKVNGLYAAGEMTGGIHGSNRIGGNAVADIIIFGRQAGKQAAGYVTE